MRELLHPARHPRDPEQKFEALSERFAEAPYLLRVVYTREGEGTIAEHLNHAVAAFPDLLLGSYPKIGDPEYAVKLTLESKDGDYVERPSILLVLLPPSPSSARSDDLRAPVGSGSRREGDCQSGGV